MDHSATIDHRHQAEQGGATDDALAALTDLLSFAVGVRAPTVADRLVAQHGSIGAVLSLAPTDIDAPLSDEIKALKLLQAARQSMLASLKADFIQAPLAHSRAVVDYLRHSMTFARTEIVRVLYLDRKHQLLLDEIASRGSATATILPVRQILKKAMIVEASGFLIAHNHPSGDPSPSVQDRIATAKLQRGSAALELVFHDHLIFASTGWSSFRSLGLLGEAPPGGPYNDGPDELPPVASPLAGRM